MTSSALIVQLIFSVQRYTLYDTTLLATETAVRAAFVITEPYHTFNWPLNNTELYREGVEVSNDPTFLVTTTCLPVNRTAPLCTLLKKPTI
jgi:hypothetical protein